MGGDYAPGEIIKGAVMSAKSGNVDIILVGSGQIMEDELAKYAISNLPTNYVEANEVIKESDKTKKFH